MLFSLQFFEVNGVQPVQRVVLNSRRVYKNVPKGWDMGGGRVGKGVTLFFRVVHKFYSKKRWVGIVIVPL